jgi:5'-methylthioadenosine phosphorylase
MEKINIGIIGGSGLYQMPELEKVREVPVDTPFGKPSDAFIVGELDGVEVAFLPRHGRGHKLLPTELPFRANIYAMKNTSCRSRPSARFKNSMHRPIWSFPISSLIAHVHAQKSRRSLAKA